uniref:Endoglucanase n=1 Tax=Anthurium amnicola TaxID=1678845 RepID=A0A1D1ZE86_9ARAE
MVQRGAEAVHAVNPDVLVVLSGLDYDKDLSYLAEKPVELTFTGKLVFELHWYGFSDGGDWENGNPNTVCGSVVHNVTRKGFFLLEQGWPLFLGEFGVDQTGLSPADDSFLSCMLGVAAELDLDWALWALQGSYYVREGVLAYDETYGILSWDWCKPRNSYFLPRVAALQTPLQGPGLSDNSHYKIVFHPSTGQCILRNPQHNMLELGPCTDSEAWNYDEDRRLALKGSQLCLQADGVGKAARFGISCSDPSSSWQLISDSKMHISALLENNGSRVCLDARTGGTVVTNLCKCLSGEEHPCDPQSQWFKIVNSTRNLGRASL